MRMASSRMLPVSTDWRTPWTGSQRAHGGEGAFVLWPCWFTGTSTWTCPAMEPGRVGREEKPSPASIPTSMEPLERLTA